MMKYILLLLLLGLTLLASSKGMALNNNDQLNKKVDSLIIENKILKERVENIASTNEKVLDLIYFTVGSVLALIVGLTIWNNLAAYRLNNNKIKEIEERLSSDNTKTIDTYLKENLDNKINSELGSIDFKIESLKREMLETKIELLKRSILAADLVSFANLETYNLVELLKLTILHYEKYEHYDYDVKESLEAISAYLKKHPNLPNYERDRIIEEILKVKDTKFKLYIDDIKGLMKIKE